MKPTAILVNTARGAPPDDPLLRLKNVVLTPHSAGMTPETVEKGARMAVDNVINFLRGKPTNVVE